MEFLDTGQFVLEIDVTDNGHVLWSGGTSYLEVDWEGDKTGAVKNMNGSSIGSVSSAGLRERISVVYRPGQYPVGGVWDAKFLCGPEVERIVRGLEFHNLEKLDNFGETSSKEGKLDDQDQVQQSELVLDIMFRNQVDKILSLEEEKTALEEYTKKRKGMMFSEFVNDAIPELLKTTKETDYFSAATMFIASFSVAQVALKIVNTGLEFVKHVLKLAGSSDDNLVSSGIKTVHTTANTIRIESNKKTGTEKAKRIVEASIVGAVLEISGLAYIMGKLGLTTSKTVETEEKSE